MILVELINDKGACLAAALTDDGDWERVGEIGEFAIGVHRNKVRIDYRLFGLAERAKAQDAAEWTAWRTLHAIRATRAGSQPAVLPEPERRFKPILPLDKEIWASPAGKLLIADDHLTPEELDGAEKRWTNLAQPQPALEHAR